MTPRDRREALQDAPRANDEQLRAMLDGGAWAQLRHCVLCELELTIERMRSVNPMDSVRLAELQGRANALEWVLEAPRQLITRIQEA